MVASILPVGDEQAHVIVPEAPAGRTISLALGRRGVGASGEGAGRQRTVNSSVSLLFGYSCSCTLTLISFSTLLPARA